MISSENNTQNNKQSIIHPIKNNENINENELHPLLFQLNDNKSNSRIKNNIINKGKKQPLKSIENTIVNNILTINNTSAKTAIKQSKIFSENSTYKTITKQPNNNHTKNEKNKK